MGELATQIPTRIYTRSGIGWTLQVFETIDAEVRLSALEVSLNAADIYDGVAPAAAA